MTGTTAHITRQTFDPDAGRISAYLRTSLRKHRRRPEHPLLRAAARGAGHRGLLRGSNLDDALGEAQKWLDEAAPAVEGGFASPSMRKKYENMKGELETDDKWRSYRAYQRNAGETEARAG